MGISLTDYANFFPKTLHNQEFVALAHNYDLGIVNLIKSCAFIGTFDIH